MRRALKPALKTFGVSVDFLCKLKVGGHHSFHVHVGKVICCGIKQKTVVKESN